MSLSSDNFTALIYLKNKVRKWKNLTFLLLVVASLLFIDEVFKKSSDNIDGVGKDFVANIVVDGIIFDDNYRSEILRKIAEKKNIKAVIVNINSPGGGIVGSEILYNNLRDIVKHKPIVVLMGSLAASGGYMAAIASDHIIARNGTLTGSIGVLMQTSEITDLADKLGIKFLTYKSSPLKGSPSPFEKHNSEVDAVINNSIKDSYDFFVDLVKKRRKDKIEDSKIQNITDGRIFTGRQAVQNGLIDAIGGRNDALLYLQKKHKIAKGLEVIDIDLKKPEGQWLEKILGNDSFSKVLGMNSKKGHLMAIWNPEVFN